MRINKLAFEDFETTKVGLSPMKLERLGTVVALVGKNGSGKTRILNFIEENFNSISTISDFLNGNLVESPQFIKKTLNDLQRYKGFILAKEQLEFVNQAMQRDPENPDLKIEHKRLKADFLQIKQSLTPKKQVTPTVNTVKRPHTLAKNTQQASDDDPQEKVDAILAKIQAEYSKLKQSYVKRINYSEIIQLNEAISNTEEEVTSFEKIIEKLPEQFDYNEVSSVQTSSLKFLKRLPNQLVIDFMACKGKPEKFETRVSYNRFKALQEIFASFFGKTLEWEMRNNKNEFTDEGVNSSNTGFWTINERDFNYSEFSEGEKMLLGFVLLFFLISQNPDLKLKESIIIIDEPELHLHPDAEIDLIKGIRKIIEEKGQLWIATHSINILSHLNYDEVFMVKDGQIKHPSSTIQREALSELMNLEERVQNLSDFLTSISDWTFVNFMIECFTNPDVIESAKENDPQIKVFKDVVYSISNGKPNLLLDFGAGKGRLFDQAMLDEKFNSLVDYSALEPNKEFHETLISKGVKKIYSSVNELEDNSFDFVVLCNVLHEIEIDNWVPTINNIISCLKPTGYLLIIEAKTLTSGEQIGNVGYLLLDENEINELFKFQDMPQKLIHMGNDTITSVLLNKENLKPITKDNLLSTMKLLEKNTLIKIEELRDNSVNTATNAKFGRQSAFLSQLHINARLAQKHLGINSI